MKFTGLVIIAFVLISCNEDAPVATDWELPLGAVVTPYPEAADLEQVTVYSGEKILQQGDIYKGQPQGTWTEYYPGTGSIKTITSYVNGEKQGLFLQIDNKGTVQEKVYFHKGQPHGLYAKYNRGKVIEEREYSYGALNGMVKKYYDNGTLMEESNFVNGKRDGMAKWYDQQGNLTIEYQYANGELVKEEEES